MVLYTFLYQTEIIKEEDIGAISLNNLVKTESAGNKEENNPAMEKLRLGKFIFAGCKSISNMVFSKKELA